MKKIFIGLLAGVFICSQAFAGVVVNGNGGVFVNGVDVSDKYVSGDLEVTGSIDWSGGNVINVPLTTDIETAIASATAGDTLVLASGTYTITNTITVGKKVHIMGQGEDITNISCTTDLASTAFFDFTAGDDSMVSDLTINYSSASAGATYPLMTKWAVDGRMERVKMNVVATGQTVPYTVGVQMAGAKTVTLLDCTHIGSGAYGGHIFLSNATAGATINAYNCNATSAGGVSSGFGSVLVYNNNGTATINIYGGDYVSATNTVSGVIGTGGTGGSTNVYGATINGSGASAFDVSRNAGTLTLYDTTLVNGTTSGSISFGGTVVSDKLGLGVGNPRATAEIRDSLLISYSTDRWINAYNNLTDAFITWKTGDLAFGTATGVAGAGYSEKIRIDDDGSIYGSTISTSKQHEEIGILLDNLTAPVSITGFTGTGASASTETGYENGAGRTWTYSGGLTTDKVFSGATYVFSFDGVDSYLSTPDTNDMSFGDASNDSPCSFGGWVQVVASDASKIIISKIDVNVASSEEWYLSINTSEKLEFRVYDDSANVNTRRDTDSALSEGWHFVVATYDGTGGATALDGTNCVLYVDGVAVASTATNNASYVAMEAGNADVLMGACKLSGSLYLPYPGDMGRIFVTAEELSASTVWKLYEKSRSFYNK